eukprot:scaffold3779_cov254-Ochromonas_danica.AAC.33
MGKGKVLRIFDSRALIEDLDEVSPKVVITQEKDTGKRQFIKGNPPTTDLTGSPQNQNPS